MPIPIQSPTFTLIANHLHVQDMPPTEKAFLRQAETIREALETFLAIREIGTPRVVTCAMIELVNFTVRVSCLSL